MNGIWTWAAAALAVAWTAAAGELRPGETATPPGEGAAETLEAFLNAQTEGDWSKALYFVDLGALRKALLERRMGELKAQNPGLSAKDLEEISAVLQTRELDPARVRGILAEVWDKTGVRGAEWSVEGWRPVPELGDGTWLARVRWGGEEGGREDLVGLREGSDGWLVAPDALERLAATAQTRRPGRRVPAEVPLPDEVAALAEAYWTAWKEGRPEAAWEAMAEPYRKSNPLDAYLARAAAIAEHWGVPMAWKLEHCRELQPGMLGLGWAVTAKTPLQAVMVVVRGSDGWQLADVQLRPAGAAAPAPGGNSGRIQPPGLKPGGFKTDLKTDL